MEQKSETGKITKDMIIGEILQKNPETSEVFMELGIHCIGCHGGAFESLEDGLKAHGKTDKDVEEAVKKMNEIVGKKKAD
ncbi:disulfide oxidoreductase [Candidatus Woesearchaeota archaeon]|nr:disulfide oxidoreductase [Candidatus Woesearchaeota archaeon]|tara:strand:+ start:109 stop:348 length:240 start_codon:yes stop_codon:yes gene_type:complete